MLKEFIITNHLYKNIKGTFVSWKGKELINKKTNESKSTLGKDKYIRKSSEIITYRASIMIKRQK